MNSSQGNRATAVYAALYRFGEWRRIAAARLRAHRWRLLGANLEPKCLLGAGSRLEYPWRIWVGTRCVLQDDVWLRVGCPGAELRIGEYTFIGRGAEIEVTQSVIIGRGCLIAPNVFITDHNHRTQPGEMMFTQPSVIAPVTIGGDVWIGAHAVILCGVTIGDGAVVAAGAVVNRDVGPGAIVGGVPARFIRQRGKGEAHG